MRQLSKEDVMALEADCYWCLTKLLDGIQDNYTHGQPGLLILTIGIHRQISRLKDLITRIDGNFILI
jgi:TBC1 domain family member 2